MKQCYRIAATLLLVLASLILAGCARTDGLDWGRVVLFSAVAGKVLDKGKPVAGLTLTQTVKWKGDDYIQTTLTDKEGTFAFPVLKTFTLLHNLLPSEPLISQSIKTVHQGKEYEIWGYLKGDYDDKSELAYTDLSIPFDPKKDDARIRTVMMADPKRPITVTCELATEVQLDPDGGVNLEWRKRRGPKGRLGRYCMVD